MKNTKEKDPLSKKSLQNLRYINKRSTSGKNKQIPEKTEGKKISIITFLVFVIILIVIYLLSSSFKKTPSFVALPIPTTSNNSISCTRTTPYNIPPELQRATSLRRQRLEEAGRKLDPSFSNCIHIMYSDLSKEGAEGLFVFDKNSNINDLRIYVDKSYKESDDILTAILLQHEFVHATQFVNKLKTGESLTCIDQEVQAFFEQLVFTTYLNKEEQNSLVARAEKTSNNNPQLAQYVGLIDQSWNAIVTCGLQGVSKATTEQKSCYQTRLLNSIRESIANDSFYQKQCEL